MSDVANFLAASREAHMRYHVASGEIHKDGRVKRHPQAAGRFSAIQAALEARMNAEAADPAHEDPAWDADQAANKGVPSSDLLTFYCTFLGVA